MKQNITQAFVGASFGLLLALSSCKQQPAADANYLVKVADIEESKSNKYSELLEDFDIIPLETRDECLIGNIECIKKRNGRYYVLSSEKYVHAFDKDGKFLFQVGNVGPGPGEYPRPMDVDADEDGIYVLANKNRILFYDLEGNFQKEIPVDAQYGKFKCTKKGFITYSTPPMKDGNRLAYVSKESKLLRSAEPHKDNRYGNHSNAMGVEWDEGQYLYQIECSHELYLFDERTEDFRPINLWDSKDSYTPEAYSEQQKNYKKRWDMPGIQIASLASSASKMKWSTMEDKQFFAYLHDKETRQTLRFSIMDTEDDIIFSKDAELLGMTNKGNSDDDYFLSYIDAMKLKENIEGKDLLYPAAFAKLKGLPADANPVILALKFK